MTQDEKRALINSYRAKGKMHMPPTDAAKILECVPYSLNVAAMAHRMPPGSFFWAGRNLRINLRYLEAFV